MKRHRTEHLRSGQLAILVLLIVGLAGAFPVFAKPDCDDNSDCDDGFLCNGYEICIIGTGCVTSSEPVCWPLDWFCDENLNACVPPCDNDTDCDDGYFCNGEEQCLSGYCYPGSNPCIGLYCDETLNACTTEACFVPEVGDYVSQFTGLNCTGKESFYTLHHTPVRETCRPDLNDDALCGEELIAENIRSASKYGICYRDYYEPDGHDATDLVRVYRDGIQPDGDDTSYFTGSGCTGIELYRLNSNIDYLCSPDSSNDAVCGKELYSEIPRSKSVDGVCESTNQEGLELGGFVKIYRGCGVEATEECGNGTCGGNETCLSCPEDCPDCCVEPDGEQISYFTDFSCEGTEYYQVPADDFEYECAPANPEGAVCGRVLETVSVLSYGTPDWCVHSFPQPLTFTTQKRGLVQVYRDGCVDEEAPECGDGVCNGIESCAWCPGDCGGPCAGNGFCDAGECSTYPDDCSVDECCGNGVCDDMGDNPPENCLNCEADCGECPDPDDPYCGDGICNGKETRRTCPADCARPANKPIK